MGTGDVNGRCFSMQLILGDEPVSASILRRIDLSKCLDEPYLGMSEWTDSGSDKENCRALSLFMIEARKSDSKLFQRKQSTKCCEVHCNICVIEMHTLLTS